MRFIRFYWEARLEICPIWALRSANLQITRGYGMHTGYAFESTRL